MHILVTGGTGYIGSHACVALLDSGYQISVVDSLMNSKLEVIQRIESITQQKINFYSADICQKEHLIEIFTAQQFDSVFHFAGLKAVGESIEKPLLYYKNNVIGTLTLLEVMQEFQVKNMIFSSSATVYGLPDRVPIQEHQPAHNATNPYGKSKCILENILHDLSKSDAEWNISILRYFNPAGAHTSGLLGEDPSGIPNNLFPYITQVITGKIPVLTVFGNDYPTKDGTGVRDYIHVVDLIAGHIAALEKHQHDTGIHTYNLGTGQGFSVMDIIHAFEKVCNTKLPYKISDRRPGDIAECYADPQKAKEHLNWNAQRSLEDMVESAWKWQRFCMHKR